MRFFDAGIRRFVFVSLGISLFIAASTSASANPGDRPSKAAIASLGIPFVPNAGQTDERVAFLAKTFAGTVFVTRDGEIVYSLRSAGADGAHSGWSIAESFPGQRALPVGAHLSETRVSDFVGSSAPERANLPTYEGVALGEVAPGVTLELRAAGANVEKIFTVLPGAEPRALRVRVQGATRLTLGSDGELLAGAGANELSFTAPTAFQEVHGTRIEVPVRYWLGDGGEGEYGFRVGSYDRSLPLYIDPLIRSAYSGGSATDSIRAILVHPGSGQVYVAGFTTSSNFPGVGAGSSYAAGNDMIVARYPATLTSVQQALYYGGSGEDTATAIAILPSTGDVYVAGRTTTATGLPGVTGSCNATGDAVLVRFDGALTAVTNAVCFGGTGEDKAAALAVNSIANEIVMVGGTLSATLPVGSEGAGWSTTPGVGSGMNAFAARFSSTLGLLRSTFFGGTGDDEAFAVAVDPVTSDIIVAGRTQSTDLPGVANGALSSPGGGSDGFVARFNNALTTLRQSTYFGGTASDEITGVAVHPLNSGIYVTGDTSSSNLRGRIVGQQSTGGGTDAFVARFYPELTGLKAVTYYGGAGNDFGTALAISPTTGEIYVTGYTSSTVPGLAGGIQTINMGGNDAFVARFDADLASVRQSTLLGGNAGDLSYAIAVTESTLFIAGETSSDSPGLPAPVSGAKSGTNDGFVIAMTTDLRLQSSNPAAFTFKPVVNALPLSVQTSAPAKVTPNGNAIVYVDGQPGSAWCASTSGSSCICDLTGNAFVTATATLTATQPYYVCVRQTASAAPNAITESTLHIAATAATFRVGTGIVPGLGCTLDADGNGSVDPLTDGLLIMRGLFGMTGTAATEGVIGTGATRTDWFTIAGFLNSNCGTTFTP